MRLSEQQKLYLFLILQDSLKFKEPIFLMDHADRLKLLNEILSYQNLETDEIDPTFAQFSPN
jgi:hypothetical protein